MKLLLIAFLACVLFTDVAQGAEQLGPYRLLRKMSRKLRSSDPTNEEYLSLQKVVTTNPEGVSSFFEEKAKEYTASEAYKRTMSYWLEHFFRFKNTSRYWLYENGGANTSESTQPNAANSLFAEIIAKNLSWDQLITAKNYPIFETTPGRNSEDASYYSEIPEVLNGKVKSTDGRVAGVLTTPRFWKRYWASFLNENRRPSAIIFDLFLCDPMRPQVVLNEDQEKKLFERINEFLIKGKTLVAPPSHAEIIREMHGSQPACMACHSKLDPLGNVISLNDGWLSRVAPVGFVTFKRANGQIVKVTGRGIGEISRKITHLPEYERCQVTHFWKEFINPYQNPTPVQMQELVTAFNSEEVGRRTNDFIRYLVTSPYFAQAVVTPTESSPDAASVTSKVVGSDPTLPTRPQVSALLKRCVSCHTMQAPFISNMTAPLIGGSLDTHKTWIAKMRIRMLLPAINDAAMPMDHDKWNDSETSAVLRWIEREMKKYGVTP